MSYIWKDIPGYEGIYQVSSCGVVRSKDRYVGHKHKGHKRFAKGHIKAQRKSWFGYFLVDLKHNNIKKTCPVHQLVMLAFAGVRPEKFVIDHKNGNRQDNRIENLEYVTNRENLMRAMEGNKYHHLSLYKGVWRVRVRVNGTRYYAESVNLEKAIKRREEILRQCNVAVTGLKNKDMSTC